MGVVRWALWPGVVLVASASAIGGCAQDFDAFRGDGDAGGEAGSSPTGTPPRPPPPAPPPPPGGNGDAGGDGGRGSDAGKDSGGACTLPSGATMCCGSVPCVDFGGKCVDQCSQCQSQCTSPGKPVCCANGGGQVTCERNPGAC